MGNTLHQRIHYRQRRTSDRQLHGERVGQCHQTQRSRQQKQKQSERFSDCQRSRHQRSEPRPLHMTIKIPVSEIVRDASRGPHDDRAHQKDG